MCYQSFLEYRNSSLDTMEEDAMKYWNSEEIAINILRNDARFPGGGQVPPRIITPSWISRERAQWSDRRRDI